MLEIRPIETDDDLQGALDLMAGIYPERAVMLAEFRGQQSAYPDHALFQALEEERLVGWSRVVVDATTHDATIAVASTIETKTAKWARIGQWPSCRLRRRLMRRSAG